MPEYPGRLHQSSASSGGSSVVELLPSKQDVASSNLVPRSTNIDLVRCRCYRGNKTPIRQDEAGDGVSVDIAAGVRVDVASSVGDGVVNGVADGGKGVGVADGGTPSSSPIVTNR